jgi:2-polyprenyl-6-methoxyphenol hydroxylase-like FAD-dependent oxidoreductase
MACISRALIVGGGVAGMSAAVALAHEGVHCDIVEISGNPDGASLALSGRAAQALDELGVYDRCCETGRPFGNDATAAALHDATGRMISPGPRRPDWPGAKDNVAVYRPAFARILEEAAGALSTIRHGVTIESIDEREDAARVTFSDGGTQNYDLVVGADGIGSLTRKLVFPDAPPPQYSGQLSIRWMLPGPAIEPEGWYISAQGKVGFYYLPHQDQIYVPAVLSIPERVRYSDEEIHSMFGHLLDSFSAPPLKELRRRFTAESKLIGRPFDWIFVPESWHRGRTLLIGDAAHATTAHMGMGAGMALEDAVVLGQCIAGAGSLPEALQAFMQRRYERVKTVVETSVKLSRLEQEKAPPAERQALLAAGLAALAEPY